MGASSHGLSGLRLGPGLGMGMPQKGMLPTDQDEEIINCVGEVHQKPLILLEKVDMCFSLLR